jgi:hypothetical protein
MLPSIAEYVGTVENDKGQIEYTVENEGTSLISLFSDLEEVEVFDCPCIQETI